MFLLTKFRSFGIHKLAKSLQQCSVFALLCCLQQERNARIFKGTSFLENIWDRVSFFACLWCFANGLFRGVSLVDMQRLACLITWLNLVGPTCSLFLSSCEDTLTSIYSFLSFSLINFFFYKKITESNKYRWGLWYCKMIAGLQRKCVAIQIILDWELEI